MLLENVHRANLSCSGYNLLSSLPKLFDYFHERVTRPTDLLFLLELNRGKDLTLCFYSILLNSWLLLRQTSSIADHVLNLFKSFININWILQAADAKIFTKY